MFYNEIILSVLAPNLLITISFYENGLPGYSYLISLIPFNLLVISCVMAVMDVYFVYVLIPAILFDLLFFGFVFLIKSSYKQTFDVNYVYMPALPGPDEYLEDEVPV